MASVFSIIGLLFGASFVISIEGLVCYDNIFNDDSVVLIGCNFHGAACATTTKKTNTTYFGRNETKTEVYYHCAKKTTSCVAGPLKHCTSDKNAECDTQCCDSNKCNSPPNGTSVDIPEVPAKGATECYQLIGRGSERVKCLFKNAKCLFVELKPKPALYTRLYSLPQDKAVNVSQYCAAPKQCNQTKQSCDLINAWDFWTKKTCSMKCCSTRRCNYLPSTLRNAEREPKIDVRKIRHSWIGPEKYLPPVSARTTTTRTTWTRDINSWIKPKKYLLPTVSARTTTTRTTWARDINSWMKPTKFFPPRFPRTTTVRTTWTKYINADDYRYSNTNIRWVWSKAGIRLWSAIVVIIVAVGILIASSATTCCRKAFSKNKRPAVRTTRTNTYIVGYGQDSQTV